MNENELHCDILLLVAFAKPNDETSSYHVGQTGYYTWVFIENRQSPTGAVDTKRVFVSNMGNYR